MVNFRAEAAANIRRIHPQFVLWNGQHERAHQQADNMRVLAGGVERVVAVGGIVIADGATWLHRVRRHAIVGELQAGDVGGTGKRRVHLCLIANRPIVADVVRRIVVDGGGRIVDGLAHTDDGGQRRIVNLDRIGSIAGLAACVGDDDGNRVAYMAHFAFGQDRVLGLDHRVAVLAVHQPATRHTAKSFEVRRGQSLEGLNRFE